MIKINVFYFFGVSISLSALRALNANTKYSDAAATLNMVKWVMTGLLSGELYNFKTSLNAGTQFLTIISDHNDKAMAQLEQSPAGEDLLGWGATQIVTALDQYIPLLRAEMEVADTYFVRPKGGFDTTQLVENGVSIFPGGLDSKVPEVVDDCNAAARCIAFELPTAAGFHLHRVNEAVLRRYYDAVTNGDPRPDGRTMHAYLQSMTDKEVGDPKVIAALTGLKDLHRNPVMHPEHTIESVDEALALHGTIYSAISHMLAAIN